MEIVVRSTEIDVNAHVNNAQYLVYLEWGREEWWEQRNFDYKTLKQMDIVTVVVKICAEYKKEAVQNDRLRISARLSEVGNTSLKMTQEITNQRNEQVLQSEVVLVTVHPETHRPVLVPAAIRQYLVPSS
ncbi:acyl-CoA thioesterase [Alicyclobacillaceae bacterium I2511]|nr:acyl-CoA thioesterase [Alicyclobacillaceae bacterium I2511]